MEKLISAFTNRLACLALAAGAATLSTPALADQTIIDYPSHWRMQDYLDGNITIYFTGSPCTNGISYLPNYRSTEQQGRLWSLLLTTMANNKKMGIVINDGCQIINFFSLENQ